MKCRPTRSPAQSAIAAQASSGPDNRLARLRSPRADAVGLVLAGLVLPLLATKLTQSPWFLKDVPKFRQPPFLHCSFLVGKAGVLCTATLLTDAAKKSWLST